VTRAKLGGPLDWGLRRRIWELTQNRTHDRNSVVVVFNSVVVVFFMSSPKNKIGGYLRASTVDAIRLLFHCEWEFHSH
jgi:hypothetical protein